jgi:hypothetical protein
VVWGWVVWGGGRGGIWTGGDGREGVGWYIWSSPRPSWPPPPPPGQFPDFWGPGFRALPHGMVPHLSPRYFLPPPPSRHPWPAGATLGHSTCMHAHACTCIQTYNNYIYIHALRSCASPTSPRPPTPPPHPQGGGGCDPDREGGWGGQGGWNICKLGWCGEGWCRVGWCGVYIGHDKGWVRWEDGKVEGSGWEGGEHPHTHPPTPPFILI